MIYSSDGKIKVTVVDGLSYTGVYADDGSVNVVVNDTTSTGVYHPCGAFRINASEGTTMYDPTGALYANTAFTTGLHLPDVIPYFDTLLDTELAEWWDITSGVTSSGGLVSAWEGRYGNILTQSTDANKPSYTSGDWGMSANGGAAFFLTLESVPGSFPSTSTPCDIFVVCEQTSGSGAAANRHVYSYGGNTNNTSRAIRREVVSSVNRAVAGAGTGAAFTRSIDTEVDFSSRHVIHGRITATDVSIGVDSNPLGNTTAVVPATGTTRVRVLNTTIDTPTGSNSWVGSLRTVVQCTTTISNEKVTAIKNFLSMTL